MIELVFATNNLNKIKEVQALMPNNIKILGLKDIACFEDIPENQDTITGNAIQKADYILEKYGYDCFADDTGLEVNVLNGDPGVYSARYAGVQKNDEDNMRKLLLNLESKKDRSAQFKTVIALNFKNLQYLFTGICEGEITKNKIGSEGFGYDPIFKPNGYDQTFAEMNMALKNSISHRGKAIQQLVNYLKKP